MNSTILTYYRPHKPKIYGSRIHGTKLFASLGAYHAPVVSYQWQQSFDGISWIDVPNAVYRELLYDDGTFAGEYLRFGILYSGRLYSYSETLDP